MEDSRTKALPQRRQDDSSILLQTFPERVYLDLRSTAPATIICMGRQYGKSTIVALKALHHPYTHPNSTIIVVGPAAR